jgi:hypothetical protein
MPKTAESKFHEGGMKNWTKEIATPHVDIAVGVIVGIILLPFGIGMLCSNSSDSRKLAVLWISLSLVNLRHAWRGYRALPERLPWRTRFSVRELLVWATICAVLLGILKAVE